MNTNIVLNGNNIKIHLQNTESFSLESFNKSIDDLQNQTKQINVLNRSLEKMTNIFDIVSNVKAMESIGYASTEGLGDSLKEAGKKIIEKVKEIVKRIREWIKRVIDHIIIGFIKFINSIKAKFIKLKGCLCKEDLQNIKNIKSNDDDKKENNEKENDPNAYKLKKLMVTIKPIKRSINASVDLLVSNNKLNIKDHKDIDDLKSDLTVYLDHINKIIDLGYNIPTLFTTLSGTIISISKKVGENNIDLDYFKNKIKSLCDKNDKNTKEIDIHELSNIQISIESFKEWQGITEDEKRLGSKLDKILCVCKNGKDNNFKWNISNDIKSIGKDINDFENLVVSLENKETIGGDLLSKLQTDIDEKSENIHNKMKKISSIFNNDSESKFEINSKSSIIECCKQLYYLLPPKNEANKFIENVFSTTTSQIQEIKRYCNRLDKYCKNLEDAARTSPTTESRKLNTKVNAINKIQKIYNETIVDLQNILSFANLLVSAKQDIIKTNITSLN